MKKLLLLLSLFIIFLSGCDLLTSATSNISGWDVSACFEDSSSFGTCFSLFWDNKDKISGGETAISQTLGI
jgi:hypothetical protein